MTFASGLLKPGLWPYALPVLLLEGTTVTDSGDPVEYFRAIYRGDRVKFALASRREVPAGADPPPVSVVLT